MLRDGREIVLNFKGIQVTPSFVDELLGVLFTSEGAGNSVSRLPLMPNREYQYRIVHFFVAVYRDISGSSARNDQFP